MNKLLIIDGSNLLFQMFFGMPARIINKDGKAIQGTLGFVGALLKIIRMTEPTHIVALFDGEHENERTELNADYKANRPGFIDVPEEENPFSQLPDIYTALDFLGIKHMETTDCETDDVVASYALSYGNNLKMVISSFDSDFFQLITDNVSVLRYRGEKTVICDTEYIKSKLGILPSQYADFKSLTGDNSDNIKGADKVGVKTAAQLINQFGKLENVLASADKIAKPSIRESVKQSTDRLQTNYKLIKLDNNACLPFEIDGLKHSYSGITTNEVLKGIGLK
ncbi:MAG: 5'-3' exonuclease H3TH domain-containing protein [Oscillospiraceae bacterium]